MARNKETNHETKSEREIENMTKEEQVEYYKEEWHDFCKKCGTDDWGHSAD